MERKGDRQDANTRSRRPLWLGLALSLVLPLLVGGLLWYQYHHEQDIAARRAMVMAQGVERQLLGRLELLAHVLDVHAAHGVGTARKASGDGHDVPLSGLRLVSAPAPASPRASERGEIDGLWLGPPVHRDGRWQVQVTRRHPGGVHVSAWLDARWLAPSLRGFQLGPDDRINLLHESGALLARSHDNDRYLGRPLRGTPLFSGEAYRGQREGRYEEASVIDGVDRQMTFRRVEGLPVVIVVGTSRRTIVAPWLWFALATVAAALTLMALWAWQVRVFRRTGREQARLLASLRETGRRLRQTQALARLGEYEWDIETGNVFWSPEGARILGHPTGKPLDREEAMRGIHPDDVAKVVAASDAMAATGVSQDIEFRVVHPDGSEHHVLAHAATLLDKDTRRLRGVVQDVTELMAARERERETRAQYQYMFEHNPLPMWVFDRETLAFIAVNDAMLERYGYAREELVGRSILEIRPPEERDRTQASARAPGDARDQGRTWTHLRRDGTRLRAAVHVRDIDFEGRPARLVLAEDVTERERTEQRFQLVARATTDAVWDWDMERGVTWRSENVFQLFGYAPGEFGSNLAAWGELLHPDDREPVLTRLQQAIDSGASEWQDDYRLRRKDGSYADVHDRGFILRDVDGQAVRAVGGMVDVSERQRMIEQLAYRATFDELTGLPNRQLLADRLRQALHTARRHERSVVVLFIDLDQLKLVNDSLGHAAGDQLLRQVARRLQDAVRDTDTLGRFGGDEFVAVLTEQTGDAGVGRVLERIGACLAEPVELDGVHHYVTASIGVAGWPDAGDDAETLLKNADLAMYQAKLQGRNRTVAYHADFDAGVRDRLHLLSALRDALHREEFRLHFQLLFDRGGVPVGMEALVRWQHPERGLLAPGHFIGVCEDSGLIVPLGRWVLREAARHHSLLAGRGFGHLRISVNVSAAQFAHDLQADVAAVVDEFGLPGGALELELTESLLMANPELAIETMRGLAGRGVCMAIDDFGTGYSSLAYLKRLPLDRLKIDRSFVKDLGEDQDDAEICASIIGLGHSLGLTIVAEGVETEGQLEWLRARGCDELQGYLLARPQPFEAVLEMLDAMQPTVPAQARTPRR